MCSRSGRHVLIEGGSRGAGGQQSPERLNRGVNCPGGQHRGRGASSPNGAPPGLSKARPAWRRQTACAPPRGPGLEVGPPDKLQPRPSPQRKPQERKREPSTPCLQRPGRPAEPAGGGRYLFPFFSQTPTTETKFTSLSYRTCFIFIFFTSLTSV